MADTQTLHGLDDVLAKLKALPAELASKNGGPVKTALRKGAQVVQRQAVQNIHAVTSPTATNPGYVSTGVLAGAVVVRRDGNPRRSGANERYRVTLSRKKYPNSLPVVAAGRFLEFGTEKQTAEPWMTPAYFQSRDQALSTVVAELNAGINRIIRKLSKGA